MPCRGPPVSQSRLRVQRVAPHSPHGYLRGEGRAGVGRSWIRSTIAQRLMYSGPLNWAGPADRWADGGGAGDGLRCAHWWAPRRWSRARWIGGGASRHRESPGVLDARCAVGTIGSPRTGDFGEQLNSGHAAAPRRARPMSSWFPHSSLFFIRDLAADDSPPAERSCATGRRIWRGSSSMAGFRHSEDRGELVMPVDLTPGA
jgi:hypothetical protein